MNSKNILSAEAQKIYESLDKKTREIVQKDYPLRKDRNEAIVALGKQGIKGILLAKITGLSESSISRILETGNNRKHTGDRKEKELGRLKLELDRLFKRWISSRASGRK